MFKLSGDLLIENGIIKDKINIRVVNITIIEDIGDIFMIKCLEQYGRYPPKKNFLSDIEYEFFWLLDKQLSNRSYFQYRIEESLDYELHPIEGHRREDQAIVQLIVSFLTNPLDHPPESGVFIFDRSIVKDLNGQWWAYQD